MSIVLCCRFTTGGLREEDRIHQHHKQEKISEEAAAE